MASEKKFAPDGKEILEYPKMLYFTSGEKLAVNNAKEEADALKDNELLVRKEDTAPATKAGWKK